MKPFIVCTFVALLSGALATPQDLTSKWEEFKAKHGKQHPSHEEAVRMQRFAARDAEIEAHNARYAAGLESYSRQHSRYSDLSDEELDNVAFGFTAAVNESTIPYHDSASLPGAPYSFSWQDRGVMTPVKDQKDCGSCYAFAANGALEAYIKRKEGVVVDLSEQDLVDCSYRVSKTMNNGCRGGWPTACFDYYNRKDIVFEDDYPYISGNTSRRDGCRFPDPVFNFYRNRVRMHHVRPENEQELAELLYSKGPLVIAMAADRQYKEMFTDLGDGIFDVDHAINVEPNHAVVLVGYGSRAETPYWIIRNSWGTSWGVGGYGKIVRGRNMCNILKYGVWYLE